MSFQYSARISSKARATAAPSVGGSKAVRFWQSFPQHSCPALSPLTPMSEVLSPRTELEDRALPNSGQLVSEAEDCPQLSYSQVASRTPSPVDREGDTCAEERAVRSTLLGAVSLVLRVYLKTNRD
ncbi:hypothetical protein OBBRIDRAFT_866385 [Obba rivulosa]|uniref:Uncharacterized protein n=1 Tax=Obba rivulosa TaxID=1052685 RepID=A0A8E2ALP0_9APHY|nr:hypothetical protein OBBRIDRAFT_866385 [Obba rivulosa]